MAGSDQSGEDMEAGRTNRAGDRTQIWAESPESGDGFTGEAIFMAEVAPDVGDRSPEQPLDGIVGSGYSGLVIRDYNKGGTGVTGNGGANQGTGVLGRGGGSWGARDLNFRHNKGGVGVHGIGGSKGDPPEWHPDAPPGIGVLAQGGRQNRFNEKRRLHAAAVVAIAGGLHDDLFKERKIPDLEVTGSIGVYAQGAEAEVNTTNIDLEDKVVGPPHPGAGVLGRGGVPISHDETPIDEIPPAAGVIGLAGGAPIPPISETGDKGVYGRGLVGVFGQGGQYGVHGKGEGRGIFGQSDSEYAAGVFGEANAITGRGGQFRSKFSAQVQLIPHLLPDETIMPPSYGITPKVISGENVDLLQENIWPGLPRNGYGGDLMVTQSFHADGVPGKRQSTLWFCVQGLDTGIFPARWAQVLLGPSFEGIATT